MKKILITGENSYIGTSLAMWLEKSEEHYNIETISVKNSEWKLKDFSSFDTVIHVAGLAHQKETKVNKHKYEEVNNKLTQEIANKCKKENVQHFIFLSTMSIFGIDHGEITKQSFKNPKTSYGKSKLAAEKYLEQLKNDEFKVAILRPPMVYGPNCKGNYILLSKLAKKVPVFPKVNNQRSMIFIDNLSNYIEWCINNQFDGEMHPQNSNYVNTTEMVKQIASISHKRIFVSSSFNLIINIGIKFNAIFCKVFGSLTYKFEDNDLINQLNLIEFSETIKLTEGV